MKPPHAALAVLVAIIWGLAYVATKVALGSFSPAQLTAIRFLVACLPALILPRPLVPVGMIVAIGMSMFTGQFLLQFFGIAHGVPAGLAAVLSQTQGMFTVLLAAVVLREQATRRQITGMALGACGLLLIALSVGDGLTFGGLLLVLGSALSWAVGNVLLKRLPPVDMLHLVVWMSLVPPVPALLISVWMDGWDSLPRAVSVAPIETLVAALYLGVIATAMAYAVWGRLLRMYSAATVTPFALLAPCVGALASALAFGERFTASRLGGMALIILGVATVVLQTGAPNSDSESSTVRR